MAKKTNCTINGIDYYRMRALKGRDKDGKEVYKNFYGSSKSDAEKQKLKWLKNKELGILIDIKDSLTMAMFDWMWDVVRYENIKPGTFERYEGIYRNYIEESELGFTILNKIQKKTIQDHYNELHKEGKTYSQIKNLHKLLTKFFRYAISEGYLFKNPCFGIDVDYYKEVNVEIIDLFDEGEGVVEVFDDEEIPKVINGIKNPKLKILCKFALGSGMRQGEILALDERDIRNMIVQVTKTLARVKVFDGPDKYHYELKVIETKNKARRKMGLPLELEKDLAELRKIKIQEKLKLGPGYQDNTLLFPSETGTYIDASNLRKSWERVFKDIDVPYKKFHTFRHTFATQLLRKNVPLIRVSRLLGHASIKTTEIYSHVLIDTKVNDVQTLNPIFKSI